VKGGLSGGKALYFDVFPLHARSPARAEGFERSFLGGESRCEVNAGIGALVAVVTFDFRIYSTSEARSELFEGFSKTIVLHNVDSDTDNHDCSMLQAKRVAQVTVLSAKPLEGIPGVVHGFSTRRCEHNEFTLGPASSENPAIQINRVRFMSAVEMPGWPLLKLKQVHSDVIHSMIDTSAANEAFEGDAAITGLAGATLGIQTADCVPILIADVKGHAVAAIHAGWRGTAARIVEKTVAQMRRDYGVPPEELVAVIGPHNAVCCYEVGEEVVAAIADSEAIVRKPEWTKPHLNQALANQRQLLRAGVPENQIMVSNLCTQCRGDLFYSYRRDGARAGRMLSAIGILP
jgi:YfiH family protein